MATTLTYFDFPGGRGEDCRIALHLAGIEWEDDRVKGSEWPERKAGTPWGGLPVLSVDGKLIGQSNAILTFVGRKHGLHPADPWEAARHEAILSACEQFRGLMTASLREKDPDKKRAMREEAAAGFIPQWGARFEREIGDGPFLSGDTLNVADLKLFIVVKWFQGGALDHIPTTVFDAHPKLMALYEAVEAHPGVADWYAG